MCHVPTIVNYLAYVKTVLPRLRPKTMPTTWSHSTCSLRQQQQYGSRYVQVIFVLLLINHYHTTMMMPTTTRYVTRIYEFTPTLMMTTIVAPYWSLLGPLELSLVCFIFIHQTISIGSCTVPWGFFIYFLRPQRAPQRRPPFCDFIY